MDANMKLINKPKRGIIVIPARLASTRLPNKLILQETGRPLLAYVVGNARRAVAMSDGQLQKVVVACDDERLVAIAQEAGAQAVLTGEHHQCGTTRIAEAIEKLGLSHGLDFVVNVQGDEPELDPRAILDVTSALLSDENADMATLVIAMPGGTESHKANPNVVKAVLDARGRAIYFSRAAIPFDRQPTPPHLPSWYHHLGIYAYRTPFLMEFASWPVSTLERQESLEQLRAIEAGRIIAARAVPSAWAGKGIDTPDDYQAFVERRGRRVA
jgi:3-deoxy-manno-octulosonate cytidylyltransferase (CMP-KDO synthetase)